MYRVNGRISTQRNDFKYQRPYHYGKVDRPLFGNNNYGKVTPSNSKLQEPKATGTHRNNLSGNHQSIKFRTVQFPSQNDLSKCSLMKALQVAEPILKKLLVCITEGKIDSHTLAEYALEIGLGNKWLENHFTNVQTNIIHQNPDCDNFDLTLKFRCIEVFKDYNQRLVNNKELKFSIGTTMKKLKSIRNDLCHNRNHFTEVQCHDVALDLKVLLGELLEIIHIWDEDMDINTEKKETEVHIDEIMKGSINERDFKYMCLQEVMSSVVEPALNNVMQFICYDKKKDTFKEYLLNKGMKGYKDRFCKPEKEKLESNSEKIRPDITLYTKIIEICTEWHPDFEAKEELISTIQKIRDIRNYVSHRMLSMSPKECVMEANKLGESVKDLGKFVQNQKNTMKVDADINCIMLLPYQ